MPSKLILTAVLVILIAGAGYWIYQTKKQAGEPIGPEEIVLDSQNCSYIIEGESVTLKDGYSEEEIAPGSASKLMTRYFGNEASGDVNGDGLADVAFILTQEPGGSGVFYYVAVALAGAEGCQGVNAVLLGDRISPQTTEIEGNKIIVNYADRRAGEAMIIPPSVGITKQFALEGSMLKDITTEEATKEQACLLSGGTIGASLCCLSASDFPNLCLIGACGCSPADSHEVKICDCGEGKCFDGTECVVFQ